MLWKNSVIGTGAVALLLGSCGIFGSDESIAKPGKTPQLSVAPLGGEAANRDQTPPPIEKVNYDEVGYASWYGDEVRGNATASGEPFAPETISAAHPTLPLPSFAEVTNLDSGRTILVRINDRGPFKKGRIIDLSAGAAQQLGVVGQGVFPVRVRRVSPPEFERRQLQNGGQATERLPTPPALLAALRRNLKPGEVSPSVATRPILPKPALRPTPKPVETTAGAQFDPPDAPPRTVVKPATVTPPVTAAAGDYFVQIGAFSSQARADAFARKAGAEVVSAGNLWRVRVGPYADEGSARAALGPLAAKGYRDARVTR